MEPWFAQWSFFLRLLLISINLPFSFAWNTDVMCGLVLLTSTYIYQISNWNRCVVMLVFHLLPLLNPWLIVEISLSLFYSCYFLAKFHLNWWNWFNFLNLAAVPFAILIGSMIFLSPFLVVIRMSISAVSFLAQLDS